MSVRGVLPREDQPATDASEPAAAAGGPAGQLLVDILDDLMSLETLVISYPFGPSFVCPILVITRCARLDLHRSSMIVVLPGTSDAFSVRAFVTFCVSRPSTNVLGKCTRTHLP